MCSRAGSCTPWITAMSPSSPGSAWWWPAVDGCADRRGPDDHGEGDAASAPLPARRHRRVRLVRHRHPAALDTGLRDTDGVAALGDIVAVGSIRRTRDV